MLISAGATMAAFDDNGTTPLMHAVLGNSLHSITHILATQEGAATLEVRNAAGSTALMLSSRLPFGKLFVRKLLDAGADPDSRRGFEGETDVASNTPLMLATHEKDTEIVSMLLDAGADPSLQSEEGFTALHIAAMEDLPEICQKLLEAGAPQDFKTRDQKMTPFGMAAEYGLEKVVHVFREYNGETFQKDEQVAKELTFDNFFKEMVVRLWSSFMPHGVTIARS